MELKIEKLEKMDDHELKTVDLAVKDINRFLAYTVHVDNHRIFTLVSYSHLITAKWTRDVLHCYRKNKKIVVGVSVDREDRPPVKGLTYNNYELMTICVGSQCLMVELPNPWDHPDAELPLFPFFANPRVIAAGMDMKNVAKKLFTDYKMRFWNVMELSEVAENVLDNGHVYDVRRYDLDKLGALVMGRRWYVDRPEKVNWFAHKYRHWGEYSEQKVMYSTYDAYQCYSIGVKLKEMKSAKRGGCSAVKKVNKKKGFN